MQSAQDDKCAEQLVRLVKEEPIEAYQIAFDLAEMAPQAFVESVRKRLEEAGAGPEEVVSPFMTPFPSEERSRSRWCES